MIREKQAWVINGFIGILLIAALVAGTVFSFFQQQFVLGGICLILAITLGSGITLVQPNQAAVVIFLGKYMGSIRREGIVITVPFSVRRTISLRVRNFNSKRLKVNDVNGNPIEIAAVIVFKVVDSAKAVFDVDRYEQFVEIQSETAIRAVATKYPYDTFTDAELTLRGNAQEVSNELTAELQDRLNVAGVKVIEARLTHLAYSTEIAQAMLQRQQASAIIAARKQIVEGAVGMVQDAILQLEQDGSVELDDERRVAMANNLLVSIVSDHGTQPVVNTGTLYQ
ncbi:MAG: SPFH domain-containing protein [Bacillota bacterium]|uniref:SPFH domain-containing protein n=1 Tax=Virgibacillus salarius TaxID=447199 RepID=A0A941DRD6_9BACI|nr:MULTISPECIES: SPFH domain-containing protein [Bacillaceae]NAZ07961.1 SPFH domain-containing protein [Agaribacter marinus]MBR7795245.1 SPFH domain-containing protein [Virgibacillus salarius]MCC2251514.1 SPFH domain-containing protein [Virgibacillus sp. AGTR]MDY7045360.1 SPFH domain-containing protein [Virgibacillus sp. M23]QRZ19959.1 SPFH domain-containing protein [Virgibacillus sp. AGTR]